jgi:hypothetical protein
MNSLLFPHFYLSNDHLIRHQYLMMDTVLRILSSDRPTRDDKEVKQLINDIEFPESRVVQDVEEKAAARFLTVLHEAYENKNEHYFPALQKFGVERTATKTFHFSRMVELVSAVEKIQALGFAKPDRAGSWCMSAPKMVQLYVTCATVEYQKLKEIPRSTDAEEHDEFAAVIETLPQSGKPQEKIKRAIVNFKYFMPDGLESMDSSTLKKVRDSLKPHLTKYSGMAMKAADLLDEASGTDCKKALNDALAPIADLNQAVNTHISTLGYKPKEFRGQYRWYAKPGSVVSGLSEPDEVIHQQGSIRIVEKTAAAESIHELTQYPGCFVWTLDPANTGKGLLSRLSKLWG